MKVRPLGATFVIVSDGDACVVVEEGLCVQTGNFPYAYRHGASCRILVRRDADIWCPVFDMHPGGPAYPDGDVLYVDEIAHKGQDGPQGNFTAREIVWVSDSAHSGIGWKLCHSNFTTTTTTWMLG